MSKKVQLFVIGILAIVAFPGLGYSETTPASIKTTSAPASNDDSVARAPLQYQDINLSQGGVAFSEEDIRLPGKNGLEATCLSRLSHYFDH